MHKQVRVIKLFVFHFEVAHTAQSLLQMYICIYQRDALQRLRCAESWSSKNIYDAKRILVGMVSRNQHTPNLLL